MKHSIIIGLIALAGCQTICNQTAKEVRYYPVEMPLLELMGERSYAHNVCWKATEGASQHEQDGESRWKCFFKQFGVAWPEDSTICYVKGIGKLRVFNTLNNHERLEDAFAEWHREAGRDKVVEVEIRFVEVGQKILDEIGLRLAAKKAAGARYDLSDFASVSPSAIERALVARHDLGLNQSWKLITRNGEAAVGKRVTEYIYPTDFSVVGLTNSTLGKLLGPSNGESNVTYSVEPKNFTMREAGIILEAYPMVSADGKTIDLQLNAQVVDNPTWHNYGCKVPAPDGAHYDLPMEQPNFFVRSVDTKVALVPGETALVNGAVSKNKDGSDKTLFVFARANVLGARSTDK